MKEPIRMRETNQLPPALRDAFGALGMDAPSPEIAQRVQKTLQALPAAAPGAAVVGGFGLGKLLVIATLIAGAASSAVVLKGRFDASQAPAPASAASAAHAPEPTHRVLPVLSNAPNQATASLPAPTAIEDHVAAAALGSRQVAAATEEPTLPLRSRAALGSKKPRADLSAQWVQGLPAPHHPGQAQRVAEGERAAKSGPAAAQPEAARAAADAPVSAAQGESETSAAPLAQASSMVGTQTSEAQRLARCKRLAAHDPEDALRELEALARDVPNGVFVQERELLEIRLHERLGDQAGAAQLKQRFLTRHPSSIYRRALAP